MSLLEFFGFKKRKEETIIIPRKDELQNQRKAFRIEYQAKDMPVVEINNKQYPAIDISVTGIKLWSSNSFHERQSLEGKIHLHVGELSFSGNVIRINKKTNSTAIDFYRELHGRELIKERNYLKNEKGYNI